MQKVKLTLTDRISSVVMQNFGMAASLTVRAALEVAQTNWTEADTVKYGTIVHEYITGLSESEKEETK